MCTCSYRPCLALKEHENVVLPAPAQIAQTQSSYATPTANTQCWPEAWLAVVVKLLHCHQVSHDFSHFCLWILYYQIFHNDLKFTTDGQQNPTSHEPRSRAFYHGLHVRQSKGIVDYYIRNSLLHKWNSYYTEPLMKVPIMPNPFQY